MSEPYDPWQPYGASREAQPEPTQSQPTQPPAPDQGQNPYGPPAEQPGSPGPYQYGNPYGQPTGPAQPYMPGQQGEPAAPGGGTNPYGMPAAPSQPLSGPYGQPPAPSQPLSGPYGQPAGPSQPMYGAYGQPAGPSQPMYGAYGQPAGPSQPWQAGPNSQTLPGWPQQAMAVPTPTPKKSRKKLWITLGVVLALVVVACGGGSLAFVQYFAPAATAGVYCGYMKTQDYTAAYGILSSGLRGQITQDQFSQGSQLLDKVEGNVQTCGQATTGNAYNYSFGASTATIAATITRAAAGTFQGSLHLKNENGAWKVDAIDTSLLGINMGALQTAGAFCAAMGAQSYTTAYGLLGSALAAQASQAQFTSQAQAHDQIDGTISTCGLVGISPGGTDSAASLMVSITRTKLGSQQGAVSLDVEQGAWKIASIAGALLGTDLGPLAVGTQFCQALQNGQYQAAYNLLSQGFKGALSEADFVSVFTLNSPWKWNGCAPDLSTYKVAGTTASYTVSFKAVNPSTGATDSVDAKLSFVNEGGSWKVDDLGKP